MISYFNSSKISRIESLLEQWHGKEDVFEKACTKNYGVDRVLSRTIYYPPFHSVASFPSNWFFTDDKLELENERVMCVAAADMLVDLYTGRPSTCFCIDLRDEQTVKSGTVPSELNVEASAWRKELLIQGVLKCLEEMKGTVGRFIG